MVSLRIPEDHLLALDQRVGLDGMRNRSDVIRSAIRHFLNEPLPSLGDRVEVNLGPDLTVMMYDFCKIRAETPEVVLRHAARDYIQREAIDGETVNRLLRKRMDELQARFDDDNSNAQR
jgi:metal-responsive CopG/Arc/MetJ family transcriptional regulator|tara:strand:- start:9165 stop:9521 length:357 start_codon:yes stop_codon:yes gene_type:complete